VSLEAKFVNTESVINA